jgi:hypothetical protein
MILGMGKNFFILQSIQTASEVQLAYSLMNGAVSLGIKAVGT